MAQVDKKEIPEVKSLRWLANMFPKVEKPQDDSDKISTCIHLYCTAGANLLEDYRKKIDRLADYEDTGLTPEEIVAMKADLAAALEFIKDQFDCVQCKHDEKNCDEEPCASCKGSCDKWEWRGAKDNNVPGKKED